MQEILKTLVAFQTTEEQPGEIKKGFAYITSLFDMDKFDAKMFEKNGKFSLLVSFKGRDALRPEILLNGHFDVVPADAKEQYELKIKGTKAFGRGALDMKGMVAVLISVMQELGKSSNPPGVALFLTGDEEIGGENGTGYVTKEIGLRPQFVLCADGIFKDRLRITLKEKGVIWLEVVAKGKTAHGAYLWEGENAIDKLMEAIEKIKRFVGIMKPKAWKSTVSVGVVETSNKTPNKVPADARAVLDIRFTEGLAQTPDELLKELQRLVPEVQVSALSKASMRVVEENIPFVQQFKKAAEKVSGEEVPLDFAHGATDMRFFGEVGIPSIVFGAVGENMHSVGEWVDLESLETNKEILLEFFL